MHERKTLILVGGGSPYLKIGVIAGLTALTVLVCWLTPAPKAGGEAGVEMYLPVSVGEFQGHDSNHEPSQAERDILPPDTTYAKMDYDAITSSGRKGLNCSIVLSGQEKRSIHRPERCLPAQGFRIESSQVVDIPLSSGHTLQATALLLNRTLLQSDGTRVPSRCYFLYWFVGKDITTPSHMERILLTNWELLAHRVNQRWAYIIVQSEIPQGDASQTHTPEETLAMLKQFIHDSVPYYMKSEMAPAATAAN